MRTIIPLTLALLCSTSALAQPTAFTFQGRLTDAGRPASGLHDFRFRLWNADSGGLVVAPVACIDNLQVANGQFTATIDFGTAFTTAGSRFIEVDVRSDSGLDCTDSSGYITLSPRSLVTAAPFATFANKASGLTPANGTGINAVSVDSTGRVGVGTASPTHTVHVASTAPTLALQDTDSPGTAGGQQVGYISYRDSGNAERAWVGFGSVGDPDFSIVNARTNGDIVLNPFGGGNVGIGTSSPTAKLDVAGTLTATNIGANSLATSSVFSSRSVAGPAISGVHSVQGSTAILGQISVASLTAANAVMGNSGCSTANCFGVFANGRLGATGTKSFRIDHPDDPEHQFLFHYSTESPEAINFYRGVVMLDSRGMAAVQLPRYFAKININPSYQLTPVGSPMPTLHVSTEINEQALAAGAHTGPEALAPLCWFEIAGGTPGGKVSWRVEAVRNDDFVRRFGAPVEVEKPAHHQATSNGDNP